MTTNTLINRDFMRRAAMTLAVMMLTVTTAWAMTKTITYTIRYNSDTKYWLDGSDNTHYNLGSYIRMPRTFTMTMGDVTIYIEAEDYHCQINESVGSGIEGFYGNNTFKFSSSNYYITNVRLRDVVKRYELSVDNDTKEVTVNWISRPSGDVSYDVQQIEVTLSDTKPLFYYDITYEPNGGTNAAGNPQIYEKSEGVASFAAATRTGYTFGGWYDNSECTGDAVTGIATGSTGDKTLYAKWTANTYSVCFNANGGTGTMSNQNLTYDDVAQPLTPNAFTREGHNFSGWNTAANGSGTGYANSASVSNLATEQGAIVNLYARWTPINYQVTFNANGQGTAPSAQTVAYGTKATEPTAPTASGYTFGGWYKESSCVNRWEFGADNVTGNTTLYAKWAQNVYTITYALDGGVNSASNPLVYTITDNITLAAPTRTGYTFTGWTPAGGVISSGSTGDKTFTAHWQVNQYTITFDTDGGTALYGGTPTTIAPITQDYGTAVATPAATLAKQGYLFNGWADLPATMPGENITVHPDWTELYHHNRVEPTCMKDGSIEYYFGNNDFWKEDDNHLTYSTISQIDLNIPKTGHTWGSVPQWTWGFNYIDELEAQLKLVCTKCGYPSVTSTTTFVETETLPPTETTDGVKSYTATITAYDTPYSDTHQEAIPRTLKVAKIDETEYSYLKNAMDAASSGDVITLYGDVIEMETSCGVPDVYYKDIVLDLNGHSVLIESIHIMGSLTVKNGSLVCNIDNGNVGENNTLTLDNAKLTCVGVYDSELNKWTTGIQWMADNIDVRNGSMIYIMGGASLMSSNFNLDIDESSCAVLENVTLSSYNMTNVKEQLENYMKSTGYTIEVVNYENGKILKNGSEYTGSVTLGPSDITLVDNANNNAIVNAYAGYEKDVTLSGRTLWKDGAWNTLCLPFNVTIADSPLAGADARALSSASLSDGTLTLNFTENAVTTLVAGTPYIIKWANGSNIENPVFNGVTIDKTDRKFTSVDEKVQFKGTYDPKNFPATDKSILFMGAENKLYYPAAGVSMGAFRAYFELNLDTQAGDPNATVKEFVLNFGEDATRLTEVTEKTEDTEAWYDLSGRKLSPFKGERGEGLPRGIYIHNGRKVIIK